MPPALYLALRPELPGRQDLIPRAVGWSLVFIALGLAPLAVVLTTRRARRPIVWGGWIAAVVVIVVLGLMAWSRIAIASHERVGVDTWPPAFVGASAVDPDQLSPPEQAMWGLWIGLHLEGEPGDLHRPVEVPSGWPLPGDIQFARQARTDGSVELLARAGEAGVVCRALAWFPVSVSPGQDPIPACADPVSADNVAEFRPPTRLPREVPATAPPGSASGWPQHRRDAARTGRADLAPSGSPPAWAAPSHTPIRASASVDDELVLVGGHATGMVVAFDRRAGHRRWLSRAPNWIHQEPVSSRGVIVVGFGDKEGSFLGRAPSGVAAFTAATGERRWTSFDESSVMTSPVLTDSIVAYVTAAGMARSRRLDDGTLLAERRLPGGVIMGPPVLRNDTLVVALDVATICTLGLPLLDVFWCSELPGAWRVGHGSPAIAGDLVIVSAVVTATALPPAVFMQLPLGLQLRLVRRVLFPQYWDDQYPGQLLAALDLRSGALRWRGTAYTQRRVVDGHMAGTPSVADGRAAVVLPVADSLVVFDPRDGTVLWTAGAESARGPVTLLGDRVILAGRNGKIVVRDLSDGSVLCRHERGVGWDRGGPATDAESAYFADLEGTIEAMPLVDLLGCAGTGPAARER